MDDSKQGALSLEDLQAIWQGGVDTAYSDPYVAAGDGAGFEVHRQAFAQHARVSRAVDTSFQALYILPWSGQSAPPASGPNRATVELTFARTGRLGDPLVLGAGLVWADELALDSSPTGPVQVNTGRRYLLGETVVFFPGEQGPFTGAAAAEKSGYGYNNPVPGSISLVEQPGAGRYNALATVTVQDAPLPPLAQQPPQAVALVGDDLPDMFTPDQLGQYVAFTAGANAGLSGRIVGYLPPTPTAGSGALLEQLLCVALAAAPSPPFVAGGQVLVLSGATTVQAGTVLAARAGPGGLYCVAVQLRAGAAGACAPGCTLSQALPAGGPATGTVLSVLSAGQYAQEAPSGAPETGGASWAVLPWAAGWGLSCANVASPAGGTLGMLDAIGRERDVPRLPGEADDSYRLRLSRVADVVTPNAVRRALVRAFGAAGWCLREAGGDLLPGMFFDRADEGGDAYDDGALLFSGGYTSGSFAPGELVDLLRGGLPVATGYWGCTLSPTPTPSAGAAFTLVLRGHRFDSPFPAPGWQAGDLLVGRQTGAVFTPGASVPNAVPDQRRWHCWLDLVEMEAFFVAQVPPEGLGEFGFAWDQVGVNGVCAAAWDLPAPWLDFYDGFPAGDAVILQGVYNSIDRIRAGGVGWELELSGGLPCT